MDTKPTHDQIRNRVQALEQECSVLKQERDALQESQKLYRMVIENSIDGVAISEQARFQYANPALLEMFGYDHLQEVIDQPIDMLVHPDDRDRVSDIFLMNGDATDILSRGCAGFIQKPFNINELSEKIQEVLR